ncbi:MAG: DUF1028 domain-containing protein [Planctomycetota bacterium]
MGPLQRLLVVLLALVLAVPASATWSVVLYNRVTGECGVAVSSCVPGFSLGGYVPVLVVGEGAAAAQSFVDVSGVTRTRIRDGVRNGESPADILTALALLDPGHQTRQYGIACRGGAPIGFSGNQNGAAALHRVGSFGDWDYAVQGNVLTGDPVIVEAERALLASSGDCAQLLLAALEGGRSMGGDGRCSCATNTPTACGSPPPSFTHTATSAWIGVARPGDVDGSCSSAGCATGTYYVVRQFNQGNAAQDPVIELVRRMRVWRATQAGRADHFLSEVTTSATLLQADGGASRATVFVRLIDLDGVPLSTGGATLTVAEAGDPLGVVSPVTDYGDGTYGFQVTSNTTVGAATYTVTVDHGAGRPVQLWPALSLESVPPRELHAEVAHISSGAGTRVPFVLRRSSLDAGRPYHLLGSASGTLPGMTLPSGFFVPLNRDRLFDATYFGGGAAPFRDFVGALDSAGEARPALERSVGALAPLVGSTLAFVAVVDGASLTNAVMLPVLP